MDNKKDARKTMSLTHRDNYLRAARRQEHEWIPLDFGMTPPALRNFHEHAGQEIDPIEYFKFDGRWMGPGGTNRTTPDWRKLYYNDGTLPENAEIDPEWGTGSIYKEELDDKLLYYPLRDITTAEEVDVYPWPDAGAEYRYEGLADIVRQTQDAGYAVHCSGCVYFERVWNLRGFELFMLDMAEGSSLANRLFERLYEINVRQAKQAARCGADVLMTGSDVATQRGPLMSPAMWREYIFPVMRDSIQAAKAIKPDILAFYHSCGNVIDMVDGFIEAGIDILDPCQPEAMDIFELKRRYGDVLAFHGGIGVQSVLPYGSPDEVRDMVRETIDIMADGGGYLCSSSHTIKADIPWENLMVFVETVREYGHPPT